MKVTTKKEVAIVLGGTFPHIELINNLIKRDYYTILIDFLPHPPAKNYADEHLIISTLNKEKVLQIAEQRNAKLIISSCVDQANVTACYVAEKLNLPHPYSYEVAFIISNKLSMKKRMVDKGIPTSKFVEVDDLKNLNNHNLNFPLIVKPSDSNSSKGVRKALNNDELYEFAKSAFAISRDNKIIVEEFKEGREIGVDCYIEKGKAIIIMTRERIKISDENISTQQILGSFWPANLTEKNLIKIKNIATNIAKVFNLDNTPLMIQAILNEDEINIIEFAPRIGGGENYRIISELTGFDIINASINSYLSLQFKIELIKSPDIIFDNYIYAEPGIFGELTGHKVLLEKKIIEYFNVYKKKGTTIGSEMSSNNRIGALTFKASTRIDILDKIKEAINIIDVLDIDGNPIMIKNIYNPFFL